MKPAAVGATLLLHTAALGTAWHLGSTPATPNGKAAPLTVAMLPNAASAAPATRPDLPAAASPARNRATNIATAQPAQPKPATRAETPARTQPPQPQGDNSTASATPATGTGTGRGTGVSIPADYAASNRKPHYPMLSRRQEEQGTVLLRIYVKADGTAGEVRLKRSSGYPLLDESALQAVQQWRFRPATLDHRPVSEWYQIAIPFKLETSRQ